MSIYPSSELDRDSELCAVYGSKLDVFSSTNELHSETLSTLHPAISCPLRLQVRYVYIPFLSGISTVDLTFSLRVDLDILWDASQDEICEFRKNKSEYKPKYIPQLVFQNSKEIEVENVIGPHGSEYRIDEGKNFVRLKVYGTFLQNFDVAFFPFDKQKLKIVITLSFKTSDEVIFAPENEKNECLYVLTEYNAMENYWMQSSILRGRL